MREAITTGLVVVALGQPLAGYVFVVDGVLIGAGDAPCIIPVTYAGQENQFVSSGAILPVSDYVEYMPNFQAKVEEWELEPELDTLRQADGKYYLLPGILEQLRYDYTLGIRTDVTSHRSCLSVFTGSAVAGVATAWRTASCGCSA